MTKTVTFAVIHFSIATTLAYALTGDFLLGSLIALIEPSVNTLAFYAHEKIWTKIPVLKRIEFMTKIKTASFAVIHFSIAFTVTYILTGDAFIGGLIATIEPAVNSVAYFFHEKVWQNHQSRLNQAYAIN